MNKGFTLIELLAVVILLSVLSGVVLFSLGNSLNNSKNKLTDNQISTIEKAAQVYYLNEGINSEKYNFNKTKSCVNLEYLIKNGYIDDDKVIDMANNKELNVEVTYNANQYNYRYKDGECPITACKVVKGDGTKIGDEIECTGEYFYVIEIKEDIISMLAKYNLNVGDNAYPEGKLDVQNENVIGQKQDMVTYGNMAFSTSNYWIDQSTSTYNSKYTQEESGYYYVYDENSNLYEYVENYETYLKQNGVDSAKATLISRTQLKKLGCTDENGGSCKSSQYSWVYNTSYWSGTTNGFMWYVHGNGSFLNTSYSSDYAYGVRPVVNISVDEL